MYIILGIYAFCVLLANISNYKAKKKGMEGIPFLHTLNPYKWFSVAYGFILSVVMPYHIFLQIAERVFEPNCQVCIKKGSCVGGLNKEEGELGCGCDTYAKMLSPFEEDYSSNWGKLIFSKNKFAETIKKYPIKIKIEIDELL